MILGRDRQQNKSPEVLPRVAGGDGFEQLHQDLAAIAAMLSGEKGEAVVQLLQDVRWELQQQRKNEELYRHFITRTVLREVESFTESCQLGFRETVQRLVDTETSFTRFGDGEFRMMLRPDYRLKFQANSSELRAALRHTLSLTDRSDLLIGFPRLYRDFHWSGVWLDIWLSLEPLLARDYRYGNSHVSRPIFFQMLGEEGVDLWRRVWQGRELCVVTGKGSRFDLIPELYSGVRSTRYVLSTPTNAFDDLDRVVDAAGDPVAGEIVLVSLGPAGTALTAMLAERGHRTLDIGHISDSYRNVFQGGGWPEHLSVTKKT